MQNNQPTIVKRVVIVAALVLVLIIFAIAASMRSSQQGTVTVLTNLDNDSGVTVTYNDTEGKANNQELSPGTYTVVVSSDGYDNFKKEFTLNNGGHILINAELKSVKTTTINSLADAGLSSRFPDGTITATQYFYENTWAVLTVQSPDETDVAVLEYDGEDNEWHQAIEPGIFYTSPEVGSLPALVQGYLQDNNFIGQED